MSGGGHGGGAVRFVSGNVMRFEGTITMNAGSGSNTASGGGSGGAVWVDGDFLEGWGTMMASGGGPGSGTLCTRTCGIHNSCCVRCSGSAGAGGRIRTYPFQYGNKVSDLMDCFITLNFKFCITESSVIKLSLKCL